MLSEACPARRRDLPLERHRASPFPRKQWRLPKGGRYSFEWNIVGLEAERKAEAECAQGSAAEPAFGGLPVAKSKSLSSQTRRPVLCRSLMFERENKSRWPDFCNSQLVPQKTTFQADKVSLKAQKLAS